MQDSLLRYRPTRSERAGDPVLRTCRRGAETLADDPELARTWYDNVRSEDGGTIIRRILGTITDSPINLDGGLLAS